MYVIVNVYGRLVLYVIVDVYGIHSKVNSTATERGAKDSWGVTHKDNSV